MNPLIRRDKEGKLIVERCSEKDLEDSLDDIVRPVIKKRYGMENEPLIEDFKTVLAGMMKHLDEFYRTLYEEKRDLEVKSERTRTL